MTSKNSRDSGLTELNFTMHARQSIVKTARDPYFRDRDPELMLNALMDEIRMVSFGDYLKRYVLKKMAEDPLQDGTEAADELEYLCAAFKKRDVPPSFQPGSTAKIRALAKNWLTQRVVSRNVVLLLGFALEMSPEDVNEFLTKALKESRIDPKDPFEVICWYCYRFRLPYAKHRELWNSVSAGGAAGVGPALDLDSTVRVRTEMESIRTEKRLAEYISRLNLVKSSGRQSIAARKQFDILYRQACSAVAGIKTEMEAADAEIRASRFADKISRNDRYYDFQKKRMIRKERESHRTFTADDITPADLENVLYSAVPKDRNGNLIPMKESLLNVHFAGKRLSRQHISEILDGRGIISRYDIISLCFFVTAAETEMSGSIRERYGAFVSKVNQYLKESDMTPLYVANPYESFVLMCMLTDDPMGSFSDVWELSFEAE